MILSSLEVTRAEFERHSGWKLRPEGACKGDRCVPLPDDVGDPLDVRLIAERLRMPLVHDETHGLWSLGPEAGSRALQSAEMPELVLPDRHGQNFDLRRLRHQKIFLLAWASW